MSENRVTSAFVVGVGIAIGCTATAYFIATMIAAAVQRVLSAVGR